MEQKKLFDLREKPAIAVDTVLATGLTCRSCKHRYKHQYGKMFYCSKQKQKRTAYGDKKIKVGDPACHMHEPCC